MEIASSSGKGFASGIGRHLISRARRSGSLETSDPPNSSNNARFTPFRFAALRRWFESDCFPRSCFRRLTRASSERSGARSISKVAFPLFSSPSRTASDSVKIAPLSTPRSVTTNSSRLVWSPKRTATFFTGVPTNSVLTRSDQSKMKPQLDGRKGSVCMPLSANTDGQLPSEPSRFQLPPPRANICASDCTDIGPSGVSKIMLKSSLHPAHRYRVCSWTPCDCSRASHALRSGDAFICTGNTRPVGPIVASTPRARIHSAMAAGPNSPRAVFSMGATLGNREVNASPSRILVMLRPLLPAIRNFRAGLGMAS